MTNQVEKPKFQTTQEYEKNVSSLLRTKRSIHSVLLRKENVKMPQALEQQIDLLEKQKETLNLISDLEKSKTEPAILMQAQTHFFKLQKEFWTIESRSPHVKKPEQIQKNLEDSAEKEVYYSEEIMKKEERREQYVDKTLSAHNRPLEKVMQVSHGKTVEKAGYIAANQLLDKEMFKQKLIDNNRHVPVGVEDQINALHGQINALDRMLERKENPAQLLQEYHENVLKYDMRDLKRKNISEKKKAHLERKIEETKAHIDAYKIEAEELEVLVRGITPEEERQNILQMKDDILAELSEDTAPHLTQDEDPALEQDEDMPTVTLAELEAMHQAAKASIENLSFEHPENEVAYHAHLQNRTSLSDDYAVKQSAYVVELTSDECDVPSQEDYKEAYSDLAPSQEEPELEQDRELEEQSRSLDLS